MWDIFGGYVLSFREKKTVNWLKMVKLREGCIGTGDYYWNGSILLQKVDVVFSDKVDVLG